MLLKKSRETVPKGMKRQSQSIKNAHLSTHLVVEVKSDAIKNNNA